MTIVHAVRIFIFIVVIALLWVAIARLRIHKCPTVLSNGGSKSARPLEAGSFQQQAKQLFLDYVEPNRRHDISRMRRLPATLDVELNTNPRTVELNASALIGRGVHSTKQRNQLFDGSKRCGAAAFASRKCALDDVLGAQHGTCFARRKV